MKRGVVYSHYKKELSSEAFVTGNVSSWPMCGQWKGIYSLSSVCLLSPVNQGISCETDGVFSEATQDPSVYPTPLNGFVVCSS